ncbi:hypothetical protein DKX38_008715 [Salix brachista]|uniref:Uncharacterized protein n=1 Tax=Salix brachista TaxID=2182728 RepID=A0A5N5MTM1_9ROSI|nr:hypothetical protein DKX38_008715 [Salix brachista]
MDVEEKNDPFRGLVNPPSGDQHFLLSFTMSTFLGPDLYSDKSRCSAAHGIAKGLPPYTSNKLGDSFVHFSQLESLYYTLRNAHPSLVLNPNVLYLYLEGKLHLSGSGALEDCRQFTRQEEGTWTTNQNCRYRQTSAIEAGILKDSSRVFHMSVQQLWPPGPFTISFKLPGPVDPRLFSAHFRKDGIMEATVMKYGVPTLPSN